MAIKGISTIQIGSGDMFLDFKWERTSFSKAANTSTINWELVARDETSWGKFELENVTISVNIDNSTSTIYTAFQETPLLRYGSFTVTTGTRTITHNTDGTKDFDVNIEITSTDNAGSLPIIITGSFTLDRITRASGVTCTTVNIGVAPVITIDAQDSGYTHYLTYGFGDEEVGYITGTILSEALGSTSPKRVITDFVWPESFYQVIPNSKSGEGTIFCTTYNSAGKRVGEQTRCNFTAKANEGSSTPVFDSGYPKIKDVNSVTKALTGDDGKLIRYASTARVEIGAKGRNYATIARQKVKNGTNYHEEYTNDLVTISFGNVTSPVFSFELEDSRGFISKPGRDLSATEDFIEYFQPTCNIGNNKPDTHGQLTITCKGSWFNGSFGAQSNSITAQYRYRLEHQEWQDTESEWHSMTVTTSNNSYNATATFTIPNFDYKAGYVYEARATDKLFTANSVEYEVKSSALFSWSKDDFEFNVPVKFNAGAEGADSASDLTGGGTIDGNLTITGDLRLKGAGNFGNTIYFGDRSFATISEPTDDALTFSATTINLNGDVKINGKALSGTWTPALYSSAVSSYSVQEGWYQQVGNVVTLGFNIKATCKSGFSGQSISISGLPFTPKYNASGGGICSGAYISGGFNFECWVASTTGTISARVQSCNNTSAANLTTSASGLFYPNGELTLGGTICYIVN